MAPRCDQGKRDAARFDFLNRAVAKADRHVLKFYRLCLQRNRCEYCSATLTVRTATLDHVVPLSRGGRTTWQNVITACAHCNLAKGNRLPEEAGMYPSQRPFRPNSFHLQEIGRGFPPNYLHEGWRDYLYWDTELDPV